MRIGAIVWGREIGMDHGSGLQEFGRGKGEGTEEEENEWILCPLFFFPSKIDFEEMGFQVSLNGVEITR